MVIQVSYHLFVSVEPRWPLSVAIDVLNIYLLSIAINYFYFLRKTICITNPFYIEFSQLIPSLYPV